MVEVLSPLTNKYLRHKIFKSTLKLTKVEMVEIFSVYLAKYAVEVLGYGSERIESEIFGIAQKPKKKTE
jgi:hypothetical protein